MNIVPTSIKKTHNDGNYDISFSTYILDHANQKMAEYKLFDLRKANVSFATHD